MLNHDTPKIKSRKIFFSSQTAKFFFQFDLICLPSKRENLTLNQGCRLMSFRLFQIEQANLQL